MNEVVATTAWIVVGLVLLSLFQIRIPKQDRSWVWASFAAHVVSAFVLIWLTYNVLGGGDIEVYYSYGDALGEYIRRDPLRWGPEVVLLILQLDADIPMRLYTQEGSSTTSLIGMTAFMMVLNGSAEYGTGMFFALIAFSGKLMMYAAIRHHFSDDYRSRYLIALLLVPSAVFWTSGVVKEAVAIGGMGWMIWGFHRWIVDDNRIGAALWIFVGAVVVSVSKAYILFPMAIGAGVWWFWHHSLATTGSVAIATKPLYLVGASIIAIGGLLGLGQLFPQYSIDALGEETAQMQAAGEGAGGGSYYGIGNPEETSLAGQLAFSPVALTASLFRPFIFEAHNAVAVINGLEMTVVLVLWIQILRVRGLRQCWSLIRGSPILVFCVVFTLLFGLGVGLSTTNLGTLSRYRVPMMPLYILVLMMLWPNAGHRHASTTSRNHRPKLSQNLPQSTSGTGI